MEALRWTDVISETANWRLMTSHVIILPLTKERNNKVSSELSSKNLGKEVDIGNESSLEDNWNI